MGKSGPRCSICASKYHGSVDLGLTAGLSHAALAERFGLSPSAIKRHAANHLSVAMRASLLVAQQPSVIDLDALKRTEAEGLLTQLIAQRARLRVIGEQAAEAGDHRTSIAAEAAVTTCLTLTARLLQQIINVHDVRHTHLALAPEYLRLRSTLVSALRAHPAAMASVCAALAAMEQEAAVDITNAGARKPASLTIEHERIAPMPRVTPTPANAHSATAASPPAPFDDWSRSQ